MSGICHGFVQNTWRKDHCTNCFRRIEEHEDIGNSVIVNSTGGKSGNNNGVNNSTIVTATNNNNHGHKMGNEICDSSDVKVSQRVNRFLGTHNSSSTTSLSSSGSSSSIPRMNSGTAINQIGKMMSGTNNSTSTLPQSQSSKGHHPHSTSMHSTLNGSRNNLIINNNIGSSGNHNHQHHDHHHNNDSNLSETFGKVKCSTEAIQQLQHHLQKSSSSSLSTTKQIQHQLQQQGKGVMMTNSHPSKSDNASVIPPLNHHNHNKLAMTSSAPAAMHHQQQTTTLSAGRSVSAFIASKNIFNNATTSSSSSTTTTAGSITISSATTSTASSTTSSGSTTVITTPLLPPSATGSTGCVNVSTVAVASNTSAIAAAATSASTASSSCLSHSPQLANSIKRGSITVSSSSSLSSSTLALQQSLIKNGSSGNISASSGFLDFACNNNTSKISENHAKNGLIEKWEFSSDGVSNSNCSNGGGGSVSCGKVAIKVISQQTSTADEMSNIKGKVLRPVDGGGSGVSSGAAGSEVENLDRRKVSNSVYVGGGGGGDSVNKMAKSKGILRSKTGAKKREKNVRFPEEVVEVIGYGGGPSGLSDDEDDDSPDPMDSASINEIMEKTATSLEDKELHRLTQKNTNFNSIKTNLLGTTCIEIGPIVGCTGGKSMEGSSKPLVSIGTFETRKEPLRIQKKISEDSADDELNEKTVEKHRKFIPRSSVGAINTTGKTLSSTQQPSKIATMIGTSTAINKESTEVKQHTTVTTLSQKSHAKSTTSSAFNSSSSSTSSSSVTTNKASISSSSSSSVNGKTSSSISNKSASSLSASSFDSNSKGNGSSTGASTTTIEVNPEQSSSVSGILRGSKESVTSNRINSSSLTTSATTLSSSSTSKWSSGGASNNNDGNNSSRNNKPVLKRIQQQKTMSETSSSSGEGFEMSNNNNRFSTVNGASTMNTRNNTNSNLIILTNGEKNSKGSSVVVGNNSSSSIASKRNSFLQNCIVDSSSTTTTMDTSTGGSEINHGSTSATSSGGVQVICKNSGGNEPQTDSLVKSELKVDLKPSVHNGKLSHPPFGECLSNRSNGTDDSSEFDDSLEDSGLDIKKCSEISESDEKSGSGSDSGNENDYTDRGRMKIITGNGPKSGLFISVDEVEGQNKKPEKLSPDSVLFSSASEMSASGSSESIPEALDTVSKSSASSSSLSGNESGSSNSASPTSASTKRTAPKPPTTAPPDIPKGASHAIYANSTSSTTKVNASVVEVESLYDDVSFYKNPMHFPPSKDGKLSTFEEVEIEKEDESIYDDCTTLTTTANNGKGGSKSNGGKSVMGSYNFQSGSHNAVDSDGEEETEKVVHRRSDGIEFIGIRKIDSESFLRERSPTPDRNPDSKRERSSSASPKTRRKVNQFFSTIGKRAGAAFSQHVHGYSSKNKSSPVIEDSGVDTSPSGKGSAYKRSMSTDEVSMTRTQEIYATLTPTSLKFKGLAPVLHKLSKLDLNLGDRDKGDLDDDRLDSKDKGFKKHKISSSIKKFLRFGSKDGETSGSKYDFGNSSSSHNKTDSSQMITSQISEEAATTESSHSRTPTPTMAVASRPPQKVPDRRPSYGTISGRPPPPPPPRVHSLDLLNRVGVAGPNGTVRPARPPPPTRNNRVAPSFTAVFNNPNGEGESKTSGTSEGQSSQNTSNTGSENLPDPNHPPCKPKRKASMNLDCVTNGISRDLETTYNHITTLNLETLKLIAGQTPTKIRRSSSINKRNVPLRWSNFHIPETKPLIQGHGFVFYSASLVDESCILLVQETATAPNFSAPFEFTCVETAATFEDCIPDSFITWKASEYVTSGSNVRVFVSVMPKCSMYSVESYMRHSQVPLLHKYFALLQAMTFWDKEEMSDLLVLVQSMEESADSHFLSSSVSREVPSSSSSSPASVLVYVHPVPHLSSPSHLKSGGKRSSSKTQIYTEFENSMKQILLNNGSDGSTPLLGDNDRLVLLKRITENKTKTVQDQIRLFLQVKLFAPKRDSDELERIKKLRSERAIQQWLDRERALCMKEAVEQTLQRNVESSISPYKRSYLEFLLTPENSAKAVLEMLIDLLE